MAKKFVRALPYSFTTAHENAWWLKFIYEFWGYCVNGGVNGGSGLTTPGGMPTAPTAGPSGFFEGSSVLATGTDGVTLFGGSTFTAASAPFLASMVGKYIVIWIVGSGNSEDSIYKITGVNSTSSLTLQVSSGGSVGAGSKVQFTARTGISYRVVDVAAAAALGIAAGNYMVGTLSGASAVNASQASSQFQIFLRNASFNQLGILGSPAGTWNGVSAFTGTNMTEQINGVSGSNPNETGFLTLIGDTDFLIVMASSQNGATGSPAFYFIEVPLRTYTLAQDANPLVVIADANTSGCTFANTTSSFGGGIAMLGDDGTTRTLTGLVHSVIGDGSTAPGYSTYVPVPGGTSTDGRLASNAFLGKIMSSPVIASQDVLSHYEFARAKLRNVVITWPTIPALHRVGDSGEFIHVHGGVCLPWDNSIPPVLLPI